MDFFGKKVLVVGMMASGISVATLLAQKGADVYCFDDLKKNTPIGKPIECIDEKIVQEMDIVVPSPSVAPTHPSIQFARKHHIKILGELEIGCSFLSCKKIMVTGTNGKTTVVTMIEKLLSGAGFQVKSMGNIGYPVSQVVLDGTKLQYAVIEVSSFQLEYIETLHPDIAVVLNLAPDHLDRYENYDEYCKTKQKLLQNVTDKDYFVFNGDDGAVRKFLNGCKAKSIAVGSENRLAPVHIKDSYFMLGETSLCQTKCFKLKGEHNRFNLLVSLCVGSLCGVRKESMVRLIQTYVLLPNRIEYVVTFNGISYYNDSKGTNIHACKYAIKSMQGNVGLIMGGSSKNEDFCDFFENIDEKVKYIAVTGDNAGQIINAAMKMGYCYIQAVRTLKQAVTLLSTKKDIQTVLLSPASASFDRYKNYAERGDKFKEVVYDLQKK